VPVVKDIGLWGPRIRDAYTKMGVIGFAEVNVDGLQEADENIADEFDARRKHVEDIAALAEE